MCTFEAKYTVPRPYEVNRSKANTTSFIKPSHIHRYKSTNKPTTSKHILVHHSQVHQGHVSSFTLHHKFIIRSLHLLASLQRRRPPPWRGGGTGRYGRPVGAKRESIDTVGGIVRSPSCGRPRGRLSIGGGGGGGGPRRSPLAKKFVGPGSPNGG